MGKGIEYSSPDTNQLDRIRRRRNWPAIVVLVLAVYPIACQIGALLIWHIWYGGEPAGNVRNGAIAFLENTGLASGLVALPGSIIICMRRIYGRIGWMAVIAAVAYWGLTFCLFRIIR